MEDVDKEDDTKKDKLLMINIDKKMKFPTNRQTGLKVKKPQRSSKSRKLKLSRKSLEKLLKEKIKQEVTSDQKIELLKAENLKLKESIKGWKQKSEDLANNCQKLATMLQGHMDLKNKLNSSKEFDQKIVKRKRSNSRDRKENFKKFKQEDVTVKPNNLAARKPICSVDKSTVQKSDNKDAINALPCPKQKDETELKQKSFSSKSPSTNGESAQYAFKANHYHDNVSESLDLNSVQQENRDCNDLPPLPDQVETPRQSIPRPTLKLSKSEKGLEVVWELCEDNFDEKLILKYHLYACNPSMKTSTCNWKKVGIINSMKLPIKVTLSDFKSGTTYFFAVRGEDHNYGLGHYSKVEKILL